MADQDTLDWLRARYFARIPSLQQASQLKIARIYCWEPEASYPSCIHPRLFGPGNTNLQILDLRHVFVPWSILGQLQSLTTVFIDISTRSRGRVANAYSDGPILDFFRGCQQLESLFLECTDGLRGLPKVPAHPIPLPSICYLKLKLTSLDMEFILHSVAAPSNLGDIHVDALFRSRPHDNLPAPSLAIPSDPRCLPCLQDIHTLDIDIPCHTIEGHTKSGEGSPHLAEISTEI